MKLVAVKTNGLVMFIWVRMFEVIVYVRMSNMSIVNVVFVIVVFVVNWIVCIVIVCLGEYFILVVGCGCS